MENVCENDIWSSSDFYFLPLEVYLLLFSFSLALDKLWFCEQSFPHLQGLCRHFWDFTIVGFHFCAHKGKIRMGDLSFYVINSPASQDSCLYLLNRCYCCSWEGSTCTLPQGNYPFPYQSTFSEITCRICFSIVISPVWVLLRQKSACMEKPFSSLVFKWLQFKAVFMAVVCVG